MRITLNGRGIDIGDEGTVGQALAALDDMADASGEVIVGVRLGGAELDADGVARESGRALAGEGELEITTVAARELRIRAFGTLVAILDRSAAAPGSGEPGAFASWREAFEGLLSADEASLADWAAKELDAGGDDLAARLAPVRKAFAERLAEAEDPERAVVDAAAAWAARKGALGEVPVLIQTGRDRDAMATIVFCVELVNKLVRLLPGLARLGFDADGFAIGDAKLPAFFGELNGSLRELTAAFESKDPVAIGDLALYELEPRLDALFEALGGRFGDRKDGA